jgi:hypothetical protein
VSFFLGSYHGGAGWEQRRQVLLHWGEIKQQENRYDDSLIILRTLMGGQNDKIWDGHGKLFCF